jgi:hypothetical protein|tara:strand:- start:13845 stop:14177 length:333 start_codon:yes stop_codon:yes gene_type:complete
VTTIIVLFNLKKGISQTDYESWAQTTDLPIVRNLDSVEDYQIFKSSGLFGSDSPSPVDYIEMISINDRDQFNNDISSEVMAKVAAQFQSFADNPQFIMTDALISTTSINR